MADLAQFTTSATFLLITTTSRLQIATSIERLINLLDELDGDTDLEPEFDDDEHEDMEEGEADEDDGSREPSLGSVAANAAISQVHWAQGKGSDREEDAGEEREDENEHFDSSDNEPTLGWGNYWGLSGVGVEGWVSRDPSDTDGGLHFTGDGVKEAERLIREKLGGLDSSKSNVIVLGRVGIDCWWR